MTTWLIGVYLVVFVGIALLIVRCRINPLIALLLGAIVLGLATGVSPADVVDGLNEGFGALMAEVGLLITLGVIMGMLMASYGAVERIVESILSLFGRRGSPYAFGVTLSSVTPSIYYDVLLVVVAPIARRVALLAGRPVASLAGPVALGLAAGNALVIPGSAMLAYLGQLSLDPGALLLPGFALAIPSAVLTVWLYVLVVERFGWWVPERDEEPAAAAGDTASAVTAAPARAVRAEGATAATTTEVRRREQLSLFTAIAPLLVVLVLVVAGIVLPNLGVTSPVLGMLGAPVIALLAGVLAALGIAVRRTGLDGQARIVEEALETVGTILAVTAVAGSLGVVIAATGIEDVLSGLFDANRAIPLLVIWLVAAIMRAAIGGQTVAGLTAIGIIGPVVTDLGLSPALVILAAGAGGCFGGQFSDNAFWMFRSLFGLSTRGTLKTYTLAQSMLSVVVLLLVVAADVVV
ncbi:gluconate permease [Pseudonocardia zijingensis]|uniref:SLC13 family permease n=1 Tax=Pseudonocardia zijingensis TaxID=153376 RepID=A0ABN1P7T4_9PSEU